MSDYQAKRRAWKSLRGELRAMPTVEIPGRRRRLKVYEATVRVFGERARAVDRPGAAVTTAWDRIGFLLDYYCEHSRDDAFDTAKRIIAGADVVAELAAFSERAARYRHVRWWKGDDDKWTCGRGGIEEQLREEKQKREEVAARKRHQAACRRNCDRDGRDNLLDRWDALGELLFDHDAAAFVLAFNTAHKTGERARKLEAEAECETIAAGRIAVVDGAAVAAALAEADAELECWTAPDVLADLAKDVDARVARQGRWHEADTDVESRDRRDAMAEWIEAGRVLLDLNTIRFRRLREEVRDAARAAVSDVGVSLAATAWSQRGRGEA